MLLRHTTLYLPAQILPPIFQFTSIIVWSHIMGTDVIGVVTLFTSVQEFLNLALIGFWNSFTVRHSAAIIAEPSGAARMRHTSSAMVVVSLSVQSVIGLIIYALAIDRHINGGLALTLVALVAARALNLYQGERARSLGKILLYTIAVTSGPVFGFVLGIGFVHLWGPSPINVFLGFALAQVIGALIVLARDHDWVGIGRPDLAMVRHACHYGAPIIVSSVLAWVTQNVSRFVTRHILGLSAVGVLAMGFGLGYRASTVAAMVVTAAAFPIAVRFANEGKWDRAVEQLAHNGALLIGLLSACLVGLALVAHEALHLVLNANLRGPVYPVMMWSLLAGAFICVRQHYCNQIFLLKGNTFPIAVIAAIEAPLALALAFVAVPMAGVTGAAISLAATSAISLVGTFVWALRAGLVVPWRMLRRIGVATLAMAIVVLIIPDWGDTRSLVAKIGCGGLVYLGSLGMLFGLPGRMRARMRARV